MSRLNDDESWQFWCHFVNVSTEYLHNIISKNYFYSQLSRESNNHLMTFIICAKRRYKISYCKCIIPSPHLLIKWPTIFYLFFVLFCLQWTILCHSRDVPFIIIKIRKVDLNKKRSPFQMIRVLGNYNWHIAYLGDHWIIIKIFYHANLFWQWKFCGSIENDMRRWVI